MSGVVLHVRIARLVTDAGLVEGISAESLCERIGAALAAEIAAPGSARTGTDRAPDLARAIAGGISARLGAQLTRSNEGGADGER